MEQQLWPVCLSDKCCLFLLPAEQKDHGFEVVSASPEERAPGSNPEPDAVSFQDEPGNYDQPDAVSSLPTPSDIFVSYSTFPGECIGQWVPPSVLEAVCCGKKRTPRSESWFCLLPPV